MKLGLSTVHLHFALVYLDDIVAFSKGLEVYIKHVRHVLSLLCNADVTIKLKNFELFSNTINHLAHVIHFGQLADSQHNKDAVRDLKRPTSSMELRSFRGFCNVSRRFVPNIPRIPSPPSRKPKNPLTSMNSLRTSYSP